MIASMGWHREEYYILLFVFFVNVFVWAEATNSTTCNTTLFQAAALSNSDSSQ